MKRFWLIILCICAYFSSLAQCTTVNDNGSVTITHDISPDASVEREDNGEWITIGQLEEGIYTDNTVNANEQSVLYRLAIGGGTPYFSTVLCEAAAKSDDATKVEVKWTFVEYTGVGQSSPSGYNIYRKTTEDDDFVLLATLDVAQSAYEDDKVSDCEILYRVEAVFADCSSWSNIASLPKADNDGPQTPVLHYIDIDLQTQKLIVSWERSQSEDAWGYVVCKLDENSIRQPLDTLYDVETTTYICGKCNITDTNRITVFAFDYCKNTSPLSETYNNIVLKGERSNCDEPLVLSWNAPDGSDVGYNYQIFMATDDDKEYKQIAQTMDNSYSVTLPQVNGSVYFYVLCGGKSNMISVNVANADTLNFVYLESVSVLPDNLHTEIYVFLDASKKVKGYQLWRKMDDGAFEMVKEIAFTGYSYLSFTDELPLPASEHLYTYYIAAPDVCGGNYTYSNQLTAMQLEIDATNQTKIKLTWNPFKPVNWTVSGYEIYRFAEGDFDNAEYIGKTPANTFTDNVENIVSSTDRTYYYIKAIAAASSNPDITEYGANSSNSYAKFETLFFIPNAFSPKDGRHEKLRTFLPACHFVRAGTYSFKVFSRAGQLLFETTDPDKGWDGTYKGEFCPVGSYVYKISFIDSDGMEQNKGGIFLLYD